MATGRYIMFIDSDDYLHPQTVELCVNAIEKDKAQLVEVGFSRTSQFFPSFDLISNPTLQIVQGGINIELLSDHICWNKLYVTKIIRGNNLQMRYRTFEDTAFTRAYSLLCDKAVFIKERLYYYYVNPESSTSTMKIEKIQESLARTYDVIQVYLNRGLDERAEVYRLSSQKILMQNLFKMPKGSSLTIPVGLRVHDDTMKLIALFNHHRSAFQLECYRKLGIRFTAKQVLHKLGLRQ